MSNVRESSLSIKQKPKTKQEQYNENVSFLDTLYRSPSNLRTHLMSIYFIFCKKNNRYIFNIDNTIIVFSKMTIARAEKANVYFFIKDKLINSEIKSIVDINDDLTSNEITYIDAADNTEKRIDSEEFLKKLSSQDLKANEFTEENIEKLKLINKGGRNKRKITGRKRGGKKKRTIKKRKRVKKHFSKKHFSKKCRKTRRKTYRKKTSSKKWHQPSHT